MFNSVTQNIFTLKGVPTLPKQKDKFLIILLSFLNWILEHMATEPPQTILRFPKAKY
jgi:hypothetical protein